MRACIVLISCLWLGVIVSNSKHDAKLPMGLVFSKTYANILSEKSSQIISNERLNLYSKKSGKSNKKILILSSHGGYGHKAACATLQQILPENYTVTIVYPIKELMICGVPSGEELFNICLKYGWYRPVNFFTKYIVPTIFRKRYEKIEKIIASHIEKENADIVISLIPFVNFSGANAARKNNIPYLLIATDTDLVNWIYDLEKFSHPSFEVVIGTGLPLAKDLLLSKNVSSTKIHSIGLPLRSDFFEKKNQRKIRKQFNLYNKPTVLIMMGGNGSNLAYQYASTLAKENLSIQIIVISGKNSDLLQKVKGIVPHPSNAICAVGFTDRVSDLMAVSDLLISKPGPGTIAEAIQMKLPVLVDDSSSSLHWEKINQEIVSCYSIGEVAKQGDDFYYQVKKYLYDERVRGEVKNNFQSIPVNMFRSKVNKIISDLLENRNCDTVKYKESYSSAKEESRRSF